MIAERERELDAATYRANVQRVQGEAIAFGLEHRCRAEYRPVSEDDWSLNGKGRGGRPVKGTRLSAAVFEVFWDRWQTVGYEISPMTPETRRLWDEPVWDKIKHEAAAALARG